KIVDRKIIRVVTPGTYVPEEQEDNNLNSGARLAALNIYKNKIALAFLNVETGRLEAGTLIKSEAAALISAFHPSEIILPSSLNNNKKILESLPVLANYALHPVKNELFKLESAVSRLEAALKNKKLSSFGFDERDACIGSAWAALDYLSATQFSSVRHVLNIRPLSIKDRMNLDESAQINLDLISGNASLFNCLDKCRTPMGRRTLREWLLKPLMDLSAIKRRQDAIGELINAPENIAPLQDLLAATRDIERALSRLALGSGNPRDLAAIRDTLKLLPEFLNFKVLRTVIDVFPAERLKILCEYLDAALEDELPRALKLKPVIKSSFNKELASWRDVKERGEGWLNDYVERERVNTQSPRLKAGYTQAFGYYLEIGKAGLNKTPEYFERRQTLVNSQRYTTPELRDFQDKMLHSDEEIERIEQLIYQQVINQVINFSAEIQMAGRLLGLLDCVASSAAIARERGYTKPEVNNSMGIYIKAARHPVLEAVMTDRAFIPNDIILGEDKSRIIILTGPNMAGKSTW
ncbi:MAG: DNA mismatch repair protein MutS, partial [Synergistaceae bacterium]|nr:DNA mismatch repair protein MutS [Synergistaceae bacterium]